MTTDLNFLQDRAKDLDKQIQELDVGLAELDTIKNKRATYVKKSGILFMEKRDRIVQMKKAEKKRTEDLREEIGNRIIQEKPVQAN